MLAFSLLPERTPIRGLVSVSELSLLFLPREWKDADGGVVGLEEDGP